MLVETIKYLFKEPGLLQGTIVSGKPDTHENKNQLFLKTSNADGPLCGFTTLFLGIIGIAGAHSQPNPVLRGGQTTQPCELSLLQSLYLFLLLLLLQGRMALLVTLFLVLVNIFNSVTANAPKAEGLTAVETWVVMCILASGPLTAALSQRAAGNAAMPLNFFRYREQSRQCRPASLYHARKTRPFCFFLPHEP